MKKLVYAILPLLLTAAILLPLSNASQSNAADPYEGEVDDEPILPDVLKSGSCGEGVSYVLSIDGLLRITGSGEMEDWDGEHPAPWFSVRDRISALEIAEGVATIGSYAFAGLDVLVGELVLPDSVTKIGECAFSGCSGLTGTLVIPSKTTEIREGAFAGCSGLEKVTFPSSRAELFASADTLPEDAVIRAYADSPARRYQERYDRAFERIDPPAPGDVNADGIVSAADLQHLHRYNTAGAAPVYAPAGDLNEDGIAGYSDAYLLFRSLFEGGEGDEGDAAS